MKTIQVIIISLLLVATTSVFAQKAKKEILEAKIKTTVMCDMCKPIAEKLLAYEKGVKDFSVDVKTGEITVKYKSHKTDVAKICKAIANEGFKANDTKRNEKAYKKLPHCCQGHGEKAKGHENCNH